MPEGDYPADPAMVAEACAQAGLPGLTTGLLRRRATGQEVRAELQRAADIQSAASRLGVSSLAAAAIEGGIGVDTFRAMVLATKADAEAPTANRHRHEPAHPHQPERVDSDAIYARMNNRRA